MSGKTGQRTTGRKPTDVRRRNARTDGASGKETVEQVETGPATRNVDKAVAKKVRRSGSAA